MRNGWITAPAVLLALASTAMGDSARISFNRDIRPILSDNCFQCHGFDQNTREAGLRLDEREAALAERNGSAPILPGNPEASELVRRILSQDKNTQMPPPASERVLNEEEKALLVAWIAQGAEYEPHWAYLPPVRHAPPATNDEAWARNPIDAFVLARLEVSGVPPSEAADPITLIRRLSFDLRGLPPTAQEVAEFLADPSEDAYAHLVDRMLASPHYGERMAVDWLDVVRYADTNGYHGDEHRSVWPYRDYVIHAFNTNKSFADFTREQIAGDLLPNATREQKVAATFNRLNQLTAEGGAQAKEYLAKYAADRVRTVSTAWLGSTMGCAECHDHKFDPFTARDFYGMQAYFADIQEQGVYGAGQRWDPILELPTQEQERELAQLHQDIAALEEQLDTPTEALAEGQAKWEVQMRQELAGDLPAAWEAVAPAALKTVNGTELQVLEDLRVLATGPDPDSEVYEIEVPAQEQPVTGLRLEVLLHESLSGKLTRNNGNFVLTEVEVEQAGEKRAIASAMADYEQDTWPITAAFDGKRRTGWAVDGHAKQGIERQAAFVLANPAPAGVPLLVRLKFQSNHVRHNIGCFRISLTDKSVPELPAKMRLPDAVLDALNTPVDSRDADEAETLASYYRGIAEELAPVRQALEEKRLRVDALHKEMPFILATVSVPPREIRVLPRGNWLDESGEVMSPVVPAFLPAVQPAWQELPPRLQFAEWLLAPENPLTARVFVNRLWAQFFGTGLSKVLDDLGSQGEWPSHPELLDWLAVEFRESGWDIKHVVRLIVSSATYRQSSLPREDLMELDPFNRLLARQTRFRLEAEFVRDNALAVSGLLAPAVGGRSVFPYQPDGYWDNCNTFTGPLIYNTDTGQDQYRRGVYTYWKRSFLHPSMLAFDAPTREECTAERVSSNTPLQALVLLNDPTYVEAARSLAARIWREGGEGVSDRIAWTFRQVLSRPPSDEEALLLANLYLKHRGEYTASGEDAKALQSIGFAPIPEDIDPAELAAWTSVARVILNLHETITRA